MADQPYHRPVGKLPVVPYREPEPWVPSGGFGEFRTLEEQEHDAELAAQHEADAELPGEPDTES